jgi:hypothetical protein
MQAMRDNDAVAKGGGQTSPVLLRSVPPQADGASFQVSSVRQGMGWTEEKVLHGRLQEQALPPIESWENITLHWLRKAM